jgi:3-oxoacyl-[acyl-carrier protein] reductase
VTGSIRRRGLTNKKLGRLVFISSTLSKSPMPGFIAHGTAKGALDTLSKYLAQELGPHGITSNIVAPGLVLTDATSGAPNEFKEFIRTSTPTRAISVPDDVAQAVSFLVRKKVAR